MPLGDTAGSDALLLDGVRILEVGDGIAVGSAGRILRSLGAEVWKVEDRDAPDWLRSFGVACPQHPHSTPAACHLNGAKVRVQLTGNDAGEAATALAELVPLVDLALLGEGALPRILVDHLDDPALAATSLVRLVPAVDEPAGLTIRADESAGVAASLRDVYGEGQPTTGLRFDITEVNAGVHAAATATLALARLELGHAGPIRIDVGLYESAVSMIEIAAQALLLFAIYGEPYADSITTPLRHPYQCRDGGSLVINLYGKEVWERMCRAMERPDLATDARFLDTRGRGVHAEPLRAALDDWCATVDRDDAVRRMQDERIPCAPVNGLDELLHDEQVAARGLVVPDGAHPPGAIASAFVVDGQRAPMPYIEPAAAARALAEAGVDAALLAPGPNGEPPRISCD